ncbi:hypothetical protein GOP47_0015067, partial [Adiantum capillus-veneris]
MESNSSVRIEMHGIPGLHGAQGGIDQTVSHDSTRDQDSSTTTSSSGNSSPLFFASPSPDPGRRPVDRDSTTASASVAVAVDGAGQRAKALKSLRESIPHAMRLKQLQMSEQQHQKDGSRHKKSVRRLSKELYVIVSWYALLQSTLFAAVAQTSMFTCEDWWGPVCMAGLVTAGIIVSAVDKLRRMGEEEQKVLLFQSRQNAVYDKILELYWRGADCDLDFLQPQHEHDSSSDPGIYSPRAFLVLSFLLGFSVLIVISCLRMLCNPHCMDDEEFLSSLSPQQRQWYVERHRSGASSCVPTPSASPSLSEHSARSEASASTRRASHSSRHRRSSGGGGGCCGDSATDASTPPRVRRGSLPSPSLPAPTPATASPSTPGFAQLTVPRSYTPL